MLLDADDPSRVLARTEKPILAPDTADERHGVVSNVVFPTAIESIDGVHYVFYGMADAKIGVARLDRTAPSTSLRKQ
jgi:beta-1,2-mannobiose phosphorylase / 1,2-beta-oligomannan phosphorylase